jgi:hypothetical protein
MNSTDRASEVKLTSLLLDKKVLTPGQLKAALDYQRSLGGQIADVLVKLGLVRPSQIEEILRTFDAGSGESPASKLANALDPDEVKVSDLKVHRRLLEKLPREIIEEYLLVLFFPSAHAGTRKIILGHGRPITQAIEDKVRTTAGVDICTLEIEERVARELIDENRRGEPPPQPRKAAAQPTKSFRSARPPGVADEVVLNALLNVLTKRGLVTAEELQIETELLTGM